MTYQPPAKNNLDKIIDKIITSFSEIYNTLNVLFFLLFWNIIIVGVCILILTKIARLSFFWHAFIIVIFFYVLGFTIGFLVGLPANKNINNLSKVGSFLVNLLLGFTIAKFSELKNIYFKLIEPVAFIFCNECKAYSSLADKSIIVMTTMSFFLTAFITGAFFSITQVNMIIKEKSTDVETGSGARATTSASSDSSEYVTISTEVSSDTETFK